MPPPLSTPSFLQQMARNFGLGLLSVPRSSHGAGLLLILDKCFKTYPNSLLVWFALGLELLPMRVSNIFN